MAQQLRYSLPARVPLIFISISTDNNKSVVKKKIERSQKKIKLNLTTKAYDTSFQPDGPFLTSCQAMMWNLF